jgi:peptide/nickel transport system substrate-binding protein
MMTTGLGTVVEAASVRREGKNFGTPSGFPVCTGPFRVQSWVPGASLTLVRNDRYWDPARRAHAARFTFQFVTDQNALVNALTTGAIDGTYEAPVAAVAKLRSSATGKLVLGQTSTQGLGLVPTTSRAVADPRVREALSLVIDRRGIANSAFSGAAQPSLSFADPVYSSYAKPQLAAWYATLGDAARNPTRAKTLLSQAGGVHSPLRLVFQAGDPALAETANAIQSEAQGIGLPITLVQLQPQQFVGLFFDRHARRSYDLMLAPTYGDMFDPLQFALIAMVPTSVTDIAGFNDPQVTSLIYQGIATTDLNLAAQDIVKIAAIAQRDVQPDIPLLHLPERLFLSNKLTGAPVSFPYFYYPWAAPIGAAKG